MAPRTFTWQTDDQEHTATIDGASIRWATVTDAYDDDRPYTGGEEHVQPVADFLAQGPTERAPIPIVEEMLAALRATAPWLEPLRLQQAATSGDVDRVRALLNAGAPKDTVVRGRTALTAALEAEQLDTALALIDARSKNPNIRVEGGATALHVAARHAKTSAWVGALRALLSAGADPEVRNDEGQTPLLAGLQAHLSKEGVETLVEGRKAVNVASNDGTTPLLAEARGWCRPSVVRALLGGGASVNARSKDGWSALLWAITKHDLWLVKMLIDAGADVQVVGQPHKQGQPARSALALAESFAATSSERYDAALKGRATELATQIVTALKAAGAR